MITNNMSPGGGWSRGWGQDHVRLQVPLTAEDLTLDDVQDPVPGQHQRGSGGRVREGFQDPGAGGDNPGPEERADQHQVTAQCRQ